jgi:hypothetical protein
MRKHMSNKGKKCAIPDCDRGARSKGLCNLHYGHMQKAAKQ